MFNHSPRNLWIAVLNVFQGGTMTLAVSFYMGQTAPSELIETFVCAYCAGVMLTLFLNVQGFGDLLSRLLRCAKRPLAGYLISAAAGGALMGACMNFFVTFIKLGPAPAFPGAFLHTLGVSVAVSAASSCLWVKLTGVIVGKVFGPGKQE